MLEITKNLRPQSLIPPYPNYHEGDYFEEYFFKRFIEEFPNLSVNGFKYIPIFWTNCYTNKVFGQKSYQIQKQLDLLDVNEQYFTVSQHDDCVYEKLPQKTLIFSMGGNKVGSNIIPLPLICSPISKTEKIKDIKVSFIGSLTHQIRETLYNFYKTNPSFFFKVKGWELMTDKENIQNFIDVTSRSEFTLAPRGYGKSSFRLYEAMQLESIPIYVYDDPWLPWKNDVDWDRLILKVPVENIPNIEYYIDNIDKKSFLSYKNEIYDDFFSFGGVYQNIIKRLKNDNF